MSPLTARPTPSLADRIENLLPQTQCTKCGYQGCRPYAEAIADGTASYDQCPPGGAEGIVRLAALLGKPVIPLNIEHGVERPRPVARIDEAICIGCTLCIQACPVDAIVGAAKRMHTVIESLCTGCDLCVAPCPVDCISMIPVTGDATGWDAWSQDDADAARARHDRHLARLQRERDAAERRIAERHAAHAAQHADQAPEGIAASEGTAAPEADGGQGQPAQTPVAEASATPSGTDSPAAPSAEDRKKAIIAAALERARLKKAELAEHGLGPKNTENVSASVQAQIDEADARRKRLGIEPDET